MDSLSPECTPLKHRYDSCFNAWFEGYLQPAIASSSSSSSSPTPSYFTSSASPSATPTTSHGATPPPPAHHEHVHKPKERLFSLIPYDVEPAEIEAFIEIEDEDEEEDEQDEEEQAHEHVEQKSLTVQERAKMKAEEYDRNCGDAWKEYQTCLQKAIFNNQPLATLLDQARAENPLDTAEPLEGGGYGAPGAEP